MIHVCKLVLIVVYNTEMRRAPTKEKVVDAVMNVRNRILAPIKVQVQLLLVK